MDGGRPHPEARRIRWKRPDVLDGRAEMGRLSRPPRVSLDVEFVLGAIWTANARVVDGEILERMGDGGYALGARAKQIRDSLLELETASEKDLLAIQLDDRALFLERWRSLFLDITRSNAELGDVRDVLESGWTGRASIDSARYRAVRDLRRAVFERILGTITAEAAKADPRFHPGQLRQWEGPLWKLLSERPPHFVPSPYGSWEEWLTAIVSETTASWPRPLERRTWGDANTSAIAHPLSGALPFLGRLLDAPAHPLPGNTDMPRVQGPSAGASELPRGLARPRGRRHLPRARRTERASALALLYLAGHEDWEEGRPTPLLPGPAAHLLTLTPGDRCVE
jgi:penicillin amidase